MTGGLIHPVILCGGSGTRLWPVSRRSYPKQFNTILGERSLFQETIERLSGPDFAAPVIVTNEDFRFIAGQQLTEMKREAGRILIEPVARNTAPAVLAAALSIREEGADPLLLFAPSDHVIQDAEAFRHAIAVGAGAARTGRLVTFGIVPQWAETGYGYLELASAVNGGAPAAHDLIRFVEKPDAEQAAQMTETGRFLWNSGVFLFTASAVLKAFEKHAPSLIAPCRRAVEHGGTDLDFFRLDASSFSQAESISIDYAVMEHADNLSVVPFDGGWSDLGAWDAVWREMGPDSQGIAGSGAVTPIDCRNTLLRSERNDIELVGIGLENIVAIATHDAVLVADKRQSQRVREAITALEAKNATQATEFPRVHRPWGWYETLSLGRRFQVKRIMVRPGGRLSLQSHMHRAEHWVVVEGTARVTVGEKVQLLSENESVYVPLGAVHRLENLGKVDLHLIEVQSGSYLGEDDIQRFEDVYARV